MNVFSIILGIVITVLLGYWIFDSVKTIVRKVKLKKQKSDNTNKEVEK